MEAVGQLTGGIAHDFNNMLTIVIGNLDTLQRRLKGAGEIAGDFADKLSRPIEMALQGARSAAELTRRLLAFSRRQALAPSQVDLNRLVAGMSELLRRTVGEAVAIETVLAGGLWPTLIDANRLENVLVNLVVNARDAMPNGGRVTIETANVYLDDAYAARFGDISAGQYVSLCVSDTGGGIASSSFRGCSSRSSPPSSTAKAPDSASRWCTASSSNPAGTSASTARSATARR